MKASNPKVMINAYRLLVARLNELGPDWNYPIHLGVTEAGDGEDGRIKSAIGIGSLLHDGIGDTIRVSLTEDSVHEIPVARALAAAAPGNANLRGGGGAQWGLEGGRAQIGISNTASQTPLSYDPFSYSRRISEPLSQPSLSEPGQQVWLGGEELIRVAIRRDHFEKIAHKIARMGDYKPEFLTEDAGIREIDPRDDQAVASLNGAPDAKLVTLPDGLDLPVIAAYRLLAARLDPRHPILLKDVLEPGSTSGDFLTALLHAATNIGSLLCDGIGDAILVQGESAPGQALRLAYTVLQSAGSRIFKTDYVACPSCGRTLFDLQSTTARIKASTLHLKGVKIAIMGCIVNGPGEMADADFGYVGGAPGKVNLYVGKTPVKFNIPEAEAVERLKDLIREHGKWFEPAPAGQETVEV
jgi:(E)-4-hydroxy-3-methylbut-2-enyl-diphosphate synthase